MLLYYAPLGVLFLLADQVYCPQAAFGICKIDIALKTDNSLKLKLKKV
jgi:hypothetical protein